MKAPRKRRAAPPAKRGRQPLKPWQRRLAFAAGGLAGLAAAGAGAWAMLPADLDRRAGAAADAAFASASAAFGLQVREVFVVGRTATRPAELRAALGVERGDPILALSPAVLRDRLMALGWVEQATVRRRLPDVLEIAIVERQPYALWQHRSQLWVIDRKGFPIGEADDGRYRHLPVVAGADAPDHAADLLDRLALQPDIAGRLQQAYRVAGRRWTLRLQDGLEVLLPDGDVGAGIARLVELQQRRGLLGHDLRMIDLRMPDRLVVRPKHAPPAGFVAAPRERGKDT